MTRAFLAIVTCLALFVAQQPTLRAQTRPNVEADESESDEPITLTRQVPDEAPQSTNDGNAWFRRLPLDGENRSETRQRLHNRQVLLSTAWAFVSLNYLYTDLIGFMDPEIHAEYESGEINGIGLNEDFLAGSLLMMQIPLSMVFLSTLLEPRASRIANIAAGTLMTGIQAGSLFVGDNTKYYYVASALEISTTIFITVYAATCLRPPRVTPNVQVTRDHAVFGATVRF